ncbi:hypothetical protein [Brevundimonas nasdae]|uniref:hypothetical protein n=1 Tax=Brevundimonas nasdae TaxID=172043 RepID=UPI003F691C70
MAKLNRTQIKAKSRSVMEQHPTGIRWSDLLRAVEADEPETPHNSVHGGVHNFLTTEKDVVKIAKGTYLLAQFLGALESSAQPVPGKALAAEPAVQIPTHLEHQYYDAFASWLMDELDEVNHAVSVGGNILKGKWGTPDVIGVLKPRSSDLVKFEPQIVSAEIKTDPNAPVVAFGQSVAYRLFSHKSYMVMPNTVTKPDLERMEGLATLYGIGLVTFSLDPESPAFLLRVRAVPSTPDMFYVNEMARRLLDHDEALFDKLF